MESFLLLGAIQGLTEFLPVSSSGHLTIAQAFLGFANPEKNLVLDLVLHVGTLLAVCWYFRADLLPFLHPSGWRDPRRLRLALLVILASLPTAAIGLGFKDLFEEIFASPRLVCLALAITASLLLAAERFARPPLHDQAESAPWWKALVIGIAQGIAVTPGISRSGATIATGLLLGLPGPEAARFSFLISIPAVGGAALLEARKLWQPIQSENIASTLAPSGLALGFLASAMTGLLALHLLHVVVRRQKLSWFSWYLYAAAGVAFILLTVRGVPQ